MPRAARIVVPGYPHHVTQRGNNRQDIFFVDDDRRYYLGLLREQSTKHKLRIDAYCLMANHVHLIATPVAAASPNGGRGTYGFDRFAAMADDSGPACLPAGRARGT